MKYVIISRDDLKSKQIEEKIKTGINGIYCEKNPDFVIAIGGDGTLLQAAHLYPSSTIFGIHTGHLGFYCNYMEDDLDLLVNDINNNTFKIDEIEQLRCDILDYNDKVITNYALNEVTIVAPTRTLRLDVEISGEYLEFFRGTGFCISTPTGSTAYNKSLDGSVIDLKLKCMQLTEIAGINSNAYRTLSSPLVLAGDKKITLNAIKPNDVFVTVDNLSYDIKDFKSLNVYYDGRKIKMAYHNLESFLKRINRTFSISKEWFLWRKIFLLNQL